MIDELMPRNVFSRLFFTAALLVTLTIACTPRHPRQQVEITDQELFREGDIVVRQGWGAESHAVAAASGAPYSHIGLLHYDSAASQWEVVHAVPGEAPADSAEYLKSEPIELFFDAQRAKRGAWARIDCPDSVAQAATRYALRKVAERYVFDNDYSLADTTQLYCSELVWRSYLQQGIDLSQGIRHDIPTLVSKDGECIFPNDIVNSSYTIFVKPFNTKSL